jgi:hypothetical protein
VEGERQGRGHKKSNKRVNTSKVRYMHIEKSNKTLYFCN